MRTTTRWDLPVPNQDSDPDEVPTHMGDLADAIDALMAAFLHGPYSSLPAAGNPDTYYYVDSGGTNQGALYRDNGATWDRVNLDLNTSGAAITTAAFGDAPAAGSSSAAAKADHRHGMMANPLTAHLAASDPHPQYLKAQDAAAYYEKLVDKGNMGATPSFDLSVATQFKGVINANITSITMANPGPSGSRQQFGMFLKHVNTANNYTIAWPASFDWGTAGPPVVPAQNKAIFISGFSDDHGATWYVFNGGYGGF
jgi:hypothetical protein